MMKRMRMRTMRRIRNRHGRLFRIFEMGQTSLALQALLIRPNGYKMNISDLVKDKQKLG